MSGRVPAVEYALLLAMIVIISTTVFHSLAPRVKAQFTRVAQVLSSMSG